jgi:hypothetical protein
MKNGLLTTKLWRIYYTGCIRSTSLRVVIEPLQDHPQTTSALRLWQCANRLWCKQIQLLEVYINHLENGWFLVHSSGGVGPFTLIQRLKHCGVGLEKHSAFILVFELVATREIHNFICRRIDNKKYSRQIHSLLNAARQRQD